MYCLTRAVDTSYNNLRFYKQKNTKNITHNTNTYLKDPRHQSVHLATPLYIYGALSVPSIICNNTNITTHLNVPYSQCTVAVFCGISSVHMLLEAAGVW